MKVEIKGPSRTVAYVQQNVDRPDGLQAENSNETAKEKRKYSKRGEVFKRGKRWYFYLNVKGAVAPNASHTYGGFDTKEEAEKARAEMLLEIKRHPQFWKSDTPLGEYLNGWMETKAFTKLAAGTKNGYRTNIGHILKDEISSKPLCELKKSDIEEMFERLCPQLSQKSIKYVRATLRKALNDAVNNDDNPLITKNPAVKAEIPEVGRCRQTGFSPVYLSDDEIFQLLRAAKGSIIEAEIYLGFFLGARRGEVLPLRFDDITILDDGRKAIFMHQNYTTAEGKRWGIKSIMKNRSGGYTKVLAPEAVEAVERRRQRLKDMFGEQFDEDGPICLNAHGKIRTPDSLLKVFKDFLKKNGLRPMRFHDLRHSASMYLRRHGVPIDDITNYLVHSDAAFTAEHYLEHVARGTERIDVVFSQLEEQVNKDDGAK